MFETIIAGGKIVDSSKKPAFKGDVGVKDDRTVVNLFVAARVTGISVEEVSLGVLPFILP
ncbi:hypothetical protein LCGC14_1373680 [marine sediment metagenome]|uniref:Uncharacterized protein n=1 Tax=marine sediment metagenome TaxID=412755 RepID=A0A0F9MJZ2_9ZZZZ